MKSIAVARFAIGLMLSVGWSHAAEVKVLASAALKTAYLELQPEFERSTGHKLVTVWAPTAEMATRVGSGESVDLVIMAADRIDELIKAGRIAPGRVELARSGVGIAARAGAPLLDIGSTEALRRTLLAANSIALSTGLSGIYVTGLLQRMGIADELKPKLRQIKGVPIGQLVARGEAEIGFQQISELYPVTGIQIAPLPPEIQHTIVFAAGVPTAAKEPGAAQALAAFLTTPAAVSAIRKTGLETRN